MANEPYQTVLCEHCSKKLRIKPTLAGSIGKCPSCQQQTRLIAVEDRPPEAAVTQAEQKVLEVVSMVCPSCRGALKRTGNSAVCSFCGNLASIGIRSQGSAETTRQGTAPSHKLALADVAMASGNAQEAYRYYSESLEDNPAEAKAWFGKATSALAFSTLEKFRIREALVTFDQAIKCVAPELSASMVESACDEIVQACRAFAARSFSHYIKFHQLDNTKVEFDSRQGLVNEGFEWVASKRPDREDFDRDFLVCIGHVYLACKKSSVDAKLLEALEHRHEQLRARIKRSDPTFKGASLADLEKATNPCFIVTAATGSDCHPVVIELQQFREQHLATSAAGRAVCRIYNLIGPVLAKLIRVHWMLQKAALWFVVVPMLLMARLITRPTVMVSQTNTP